LEDETDALQQQIEELEQQASSEALLLQRCAALDSKVSELQTSSAEVQQQLAGAVKKLQQAQETAVELRDMHKEVGCWHCWLSVVEP
jgi:seryl-tRNA synthetase